jgi:hypothetical protein
MRCYESPLHLFDETPRNKQEFLTTSWINRNTHKSTSYLQVSFPGHHSPLQLDLCSWQVSTHNHNTQQTFPLIEASNVLLISMPHCDAYGHIYNEALSEIAGVDDNYPEYDCIIAPLSPLMIRVIDYFKNLPISPRIKFVRMRESFELRAKNITTLFLHPFLFSNVKSNSAKLKSIFEANMPVQRTDKPFLVYCSRNNAKTVGHKRQMAEHNEFEIVECLRQHADKHNMEFVMFSREEQDGVIPISRQYELFTNAKLVVGPHGGAFSNCVFLQSDIKPSIIEFVENPGKVFDIMFKGFLSELADYYVIPFCSAPKSFLGNWEIIDNTEIDIEQLQKILSNLK